MTIFIEDFERTENSDEIFGIIGRALVIATRFDSMCKTLSQAVELKMPTLLRGISDSDFDSLVEKALKKSSTLDKSIKNIGLPDSVAVILHDARKARNAVAHDLAVGLEGCVDTKIDESGFLTEVSEYLFDLVHGEVLISILIHEFNGEDPIRPEFIPAYKDKIVRWVIEK
ncbi:MAG: hypothetical protein KDI17_16970 [Halioglobus sp.]|nr:hypothetical protein [Halioglobus sp.]